MFSLRNSENLPPFKAPLKANTAQYAMVTIYVYGPIFGNGHDLVIENNAASNTGSYTDFGMGYQAPSGVVNPKTVLAGSRDFTPDEVEVFYRV